MASRLSYQSKSWNQRSAAWFATLMDDCHRVTIWHNSHCSHFGHTARRPWSEISYCAWMLNVSKSSKGPLGADFKHQKCRNLCISMYFLFVKTFVATDKKIVTQLSMSFRGQKMAWWSSGTSEQQRSEHFHLGPGLHSILADTSCSAMLAISCNYVFLNFRAHNLWKYLLNKNMKP